MKKIVAIIWVVILIVHTKLSLAGEYNILLLPAPYCSQAGVEKKTSENLSIGIIGRLNCHSERPTYGDKNNEVDSKFSRALFPLKYSFNGTYSSGPFVQGAAGVEESEFKSDAGSSADVTYIDLAVHGGYQWYFSSGFDISILGGIAHLQEVSSSKQIFAGESTSVEDFLNKNTETNTHFGAGVILGWSF